MVARAMYCEPCPACCTTCFSDRIDAAAEKAIDMAKDERRWAEIDRAEKREAAMHGLREED